MSQTTVPPGGMSPGIAGMKYDTGPHDIVSGFNAEASAQIPFGYGLMKAPNGAQDSYVLPTGPSGTMEIAGLNVFSLTHVRAGAVDAAGVFAGDLGASGLLPKAGMQVARQGRFWVPVDYDVRNGDRAFCRVTATGAQTPGSWVGTNLGGSYVRDCRAQAVFRSATYTAADGTTRIAVLEVDFTNQPA